MLAAGFIIPQNMRFSVGQMGYVYWDLGGIYGIREVGWVLRPKKGCVVVSPFEGLGIGLLHTILPGGEIPQTPFFFIVS